MATGRFAPSPTGPLHVGNLRTALLAWLFARSSGGRYLLRFEDLDAAAARPAHVASHQRDLRALGLDWDGEAMRQRDRLDRYRDALDRLSATGLTYPCYCTRREIREAALAPHGDLPDGAYPGTCRSLTAAQRRRHHDEGRRPALRLRADGVRRRYVDRVLGPVEAVVDDLVVQRGDGTPAYHLAVVVDDDAQGVEEVVRGDDLARSTPRQIVVAELLGIEPPTYAHVPLALNRDGARLAKRDGAVTLADLAAAGVEADAVLAHLAVSLGLAEPGERPTTAQLLARFDPAAVPAQPWVVDPERLLDPP